MITVWSFDSQLLSTNSLFAWNQFSFLDKQKNWCIFWYKSINETSVSLTSTDWSIHSISIKSDLPIFIDLLTDKSIPIFIDRLLQKLHQRYFERAIDLIIVKNWEPTNLAPVVQMLGQFYTRQWNFDFFKNKILRNKTCTNKKLRQWGVSNYWDLEHLVHVLNVSRHEIWRIWISSYLEFLEGNFKQSFFILESMTINIKVCVYNLCLTLSLGHKYYYYIQLLALS